MEPLTMREAMDVLQGIEADIEHVIMSMNRDLDHRGGFEAHMYDLKHHVADAKELLGARIHGQLRTSFNVPDWDKPLSRC